MIFLNDEAIEPTIFPDKTSQIWNIPRTTNIEHEILWLFEGEAEFMWLAQLTSLLRRMNPFCDLYLEMPYLPYARQDKYICNNECFSLTVFAKLLNYLKFKQIFVTDVHSHIAKDRIKKLRNIKPDDQILHAKSEVLPQIICYPDIGAFWRYYNGEDEICITGQKERDPSTGKITNYTLDGSISHGSKVLIIDDICDGGATFIMLADLLFKDGASEVSLYVTHGLFSKGIRVLRDAGIKRIFTRHGEVIGDDVSHSLHGLLQNGTS